MIDLKLQSLKEEPSQPSTNVSQHSKLDENRKLYSNVVQARNSNVPAKENHVLVLKVNENVTITDGNDLKAVNESIKCKISDLNVNFYKVKEKTGNVIIGFPDKGSLFICKSICKNTKENVIKNNNYWYKQGSF